MQVITIDNLTDAVALESEWLELCACHPFRSPHWLIPWWKQFSGDHQLSLLAVRRQPSEPEGLPRGIDSESGSLVGLLPLYRTTSGELRLLGDGSVCTDHSTLLILPTADQDSVVQAIADYLVQRSLDEPSFWQCMVLDCIPETDSPLRKLAVELERAECQVYAGRNEQLWQLDITAGWDAYLQNLSKNSRKNMRRLAVKREQVDVRWIDDACDLDPYLDCLIDLHQKNWQSRGEPGCFADFRFTKFVREAAARFVESSQARFLVIEKHGQVISADFALCDAQTLFCYQAGVDPDQLDSEPGKIANVELMQRAARDGFAAVDFLRGNEPYKAQFRAEPQWAVDYRIAAPRWSARLNHQFWMAGLSMRKMVKSFLQPSE